MKANLYKVVCAVFLNVTAIAQGIFEFRNATIHDPQAATRVGTSDGQFAGPDYWAQMLAGQTIDSLTPVSEPHQHYGGALPGLVYGGVVEVPGSLPYSTVYVQMVAWDGRLWGSSLASVPPAWLGKTDIVTVELSDARFGHPALRPLFTQPAIVPIPEPSIVLLLCIGGVASVWGDRRSSKDRSRQPGCNEVI